MEVADLDGRASSQLTIRTAQLTVTSSSLLVRNGRHRSNSLDKERSWRPASGFASKHQAEVKTKCLRRERQMQRARKIQQMHEDKRKQEDEMVKGPRPNDHVVLKEGEWRTVISHDRRTRPDQMLHGSDSSALDRNRSLDSPSMSVVMSAGRSLSQDEMEAAAVARRKKRQQMTRRPKTPVKRVENEMETHVNGVPHPSLLGEVMFARRSSLQRLADNLYVNSTVTVRNGRFSNGNVRRHSPTIVARSSDHGMRKTKSTSSVIVHHGSTKTYYYNESADSSPRGHHAGNRKNRQSSFQLDSPRSPRSGSDSHGSPRTRKCGDKRDFFFRNLDYELRNQLQVDEVAEFSVTDFEMATKISQAVLDLFAPLKEDTTSESGNEDHEDGRTAIQERKKYPLVVTDGTACIGGNVLSFCDFFMHVNAIENNATRVQMLRHNLQVLKKTNVKCIHANYLDVMLELQQDVVFLDPPWGGPEYKDLNKVDLFLGDVPLHEICTRLQSSTKCIILKVPSNFDDAKFSQQVPGNVIIRRDLKKMHIVLLDFRGPT
ncbi:unnamed protein product [Peronospora effusa]|uniref:Trimethylguanosine synthase n=1 Tax=Peronospora effusa TaxID=542832 RepID=A0A3R7XXV3_9STRA|nr:hypothetical protein DD237_003902 [Peronospora effusa]CAI5705768.1 unnamed protein product [Peronospora effusa]